MTMTGMERQGSRLTGRLEANLVKRKEEKRMTGWETVFEDKIDVGGEDNSREDCKLQGDNPWVGNMSLGSQEDWAGVDKLEGARAI